MPRLTFRDAHQWALRYGKHLTSAERTAFIDLVAPHFTEEQREHIHDAVQPVDPDISSLSVGDQVIGLMQHDDEFRFPSDDYPMGVLTVVNNMTPAAREAWMATQQRSAEIDRSGKIGPFMPVDFDAMCAEANVKPEHVREINKQVEGERTQGQLMERMGTDSDRPPDPPSTRDFVEASYDVHTESASAES